MVYTPSMTSPFVPGMFPCAFSPVAAACSSARAPFTEPARLITSLPFVYQPSSSELACRMYQPPPLLWFTDDCQEPQSLLTGWAVVVENAANWPVIELSWLAKVPVRRPPDTRPPASKKAVSGPPAKMKVKDTESLLTLPPITGSEPNAEPQTDAQLPPDTCAARPAAAAMRASGAEKTRSSRPPSPVLAAMTPAYVLDAGRDGLRTSLWHPASAATSATAATGPQTAEHAGWNDER